MSEQKAKFVRALAEYLCEGQAKKSIELEMGKESAKEWSKLRSTCPTFGWCSVDEAEKILAKFLE